MVKYQLNTVITLSALLALAGCADDSTTQASVKDAGLAGMMEEGDGVEQGADGEAADSDGTAEGSSAQADTDSSSAGDTDSAGSSASGGDTTATDSTSTSGDPTTNEPQADPSSTSDPQSTVETDAGAAEASEPANDGDAGAQPAPEVDSDGGSTPQDVVESDGGTVAPPRACLPGYTGANCDQCAEGYVASGDQCLEPCVALACGAHGECVENADATVECSCEQGYTGADCTDCAVGYRSARSADGLVCGLNTPATTDMVVWLDADYEDSFEYGTSGEVWRWYSRAGEQTAFSDGGDASTRPTKIRSRSGRDWVHFDGENDRLRRVVDFTSGSYSIFLVARASADVSTQILLSGIDVATEDPGLRLDTRNYAQELMMRHQMPFAGDYDQINVTDYDLSGGAIVHVERNPGLLQALGLWDGSSMSVVESTTPAFGGDLILQLGALAGAPNPYALQGDIAELIIFAPALASTQKYEDVRDYLTAKWDL